MRIVLVASLLFFTPLLFAQIHPTPHELRFGMVTALEGPAATLGQNMLAGVQAAFFECNQDGGIRGRPLRLLAVNDGYEPTKTLPVLTDLIVNQQVLGIIGNVGTPTAIAALPVIEKHKIAFFGAYTGAGVLRRSPPSRYVINYRASYAQETSAMVDALVSHAGLKTTEIAFFTQRDGYGDSGFAAGLAALNKYGDFPQGYKVPHGRYERNTLAIEHALADLLEREILPRAVIMVGAYQPCAKFIRLAAEYDFKPIYLNLSFVGTTPLAAELHRHGLANGVIITQVVPHYESKNLAIVKSYRQALDQLSKYQKVQHAPSFGSLEGYIAGKILCKALLSFPADLADRESIIDALESLGEFKLCPDGIQLTLNRQQHQASNRVWPTLLKNGKAVAFQWSELSWHRKR